MLGTYSNFPKKAHKIANYTFSISDRRIQITLCETFHKLNKTTLSLEDVTIPSVPKCTTVFELGVAENSDFNYIDTEEKNRLLKTIRKKTLPIIDFLCLIRYYKIEAQTKTPLKFDHFMLRFLFTEKAMQMRIYHEKGPMHVSPKDLPAFVVGRINAEFSRKVMKSSRI